MIDLVGTGYQFCARVLFLKGPPGWGSLSIERTSLHLSRNLTSSSSSATTPSKLRLVAAMAGWLLLRRSISRRAGLNGGFYYTQENLFQIGKRNRSFYKVESWERWKRGKGMRSMV